LNKQLPTWTPPSWWEAITQEGGLSLTLFGEVLNPRPVFLAFLVITLLLLSLPLLILSKKKELKDKWISWFFIAFIVGPLIWVGETMTTFLAIAISFIAVSEYSKLLSLSKLDKNVLLSFSISLPLFALLLPNFIALLPLVLLLLSVVPLLNSDAQTGAIRSGYLAFGVIWLCWAPSHLVTLYSEAFLIALAVAVNDIFSWVGGKSMGKLPILRTHFSKLSPNKTIAGLLGGVFGSWGILQITNTFSLGLFLAIAIGAPLGDLVESMIKRQSGKKDAGSILPGFGGILDRVDSLLLVLPLAAVLA